MKYTRLILTALLTSLVLGACKDKLNVVPYDSLPTGESLSDLAGLQAAMVGTYAGMRSVSYYGERFLAVGEISGDNTYISIQNSNRFISSFRRNYAANDADVLAIWDQIYAVLLDANNIINNADAAKGDAGQKNIIKAKALFVRALCHFDLARLFARPYAQGGGSQLGIPIILKFAVGQPPRNTVKEVYDQVITDLKASRALFADNAIGDAYEINQNAVTALLSRVYLYEGDNASAITEASGIIGSGQYSLTEAADLPDFFNTSNNPEEIFTLRFLTSESLSSDNYGNLYRRPGYGDIRVSQDLLQDFGADSLKDARYTAYISGFTGSAGEFQNNKFVGEDGNLGMYSPKILRLAEVYLNRAEAYAKIQQYGLALADLNTLRAKRGNLVVLTSSNTPNDQVLATVLDDRRKEFMFEGQRFFDLTRNSLDISRSAECGSINEISAPCSIPATSNFIVMPIPQQELSVNPIQQNPGYGK